MPHSPKSFPKIRPIERPAPKILIVDDDREIRNMLTIFLMAEGFGTVEAETGRQGLKSALCEKPDLMLLDLGLPDIDGEVVVSTLRTWTHFPIIVLTARSEVQQTSKLLYLGADDYVGKPFHPAVLLARIKANLRKHRPPMPDDQRPKNGPLEMDLVRHQVWVDDQLIGFTPKEFDLLRLLLANRGGVVPHDKLLTEVWGAQRANDKAHLRVFVGQLREKLRFHPKLSASIVSESGVGYRMDVLEDR